VSARKWAVYVVTSELCHGPHGFGRRTVEKIDSFHDDQEQAEVHARTVGGNVVVRELATPKEIKP
jgi:hypothetical protein